MTARQLPSSTDVNSSLEQTSTRKPRKRTCGSVTIMAAFSFTRRTSLHGLPRIMASGTNPGVSFLWLLIVMTTFGCSVYHLFRLVDDFLSYPVTEARRLSASRKFVLPDITICPLALYNGNFLDKIRLRNRQRLFDGYMKQTLFGCNRKQLNNCTKCHHNCDASKRILRSRYFDSEYFLRPKDIVVSCSLKGEFFPYREMKLTPDPDYTQCFTIGSQVNITETGIRGG